jgi:peptide chain release factor 2
VLEQNTSVEGFWDDNDSAQTTLKKIRVLQNWIESWDNCHQSAIDLEDMFVLAKEENDQEVLDSISLDIETLDRDIKTLELKKMLDGEDDAREVIMSFHPGSGGTESQDWAAMLYRMYCRYFDKKQWPYKTIDYQDGEEAGLKSATIQVNQEYAYGYLRSEIGVHRLVRISPFDSGARRHTSFSAVYVYPIIEDVDFEIADKDIRVDTYRASGAGGQHVNKTDSAVRMTHIPTGLVASCQNERSQLQNRETALKVLKAAVYQKFQEEEAAKRNDKLAKKRKIEWGSHIRNYVLHPYNMVKDLRTNKETSDTSGVLDGDIQVFIDAYLLSTGEET